MRLLSILLAALLLGGCANSLYFANKSRGALAIETDLSNPEAPVTGVFGARERTVVVTPGLGDATDSSVNGEALSMISRFRFGRKPNKGIVVNAALITGAAASGLTDDQAKGAAASMVSFDYAPNAVGECVRDWLRNGPGDAGARRQAMQDFITQQGLKGANGAPLKMVEFWSSGRHDEQLAAFASANNISCGA